MASDEMSRPGTAGSNPRKRGSMARSGLSLGLLPRSTPKGAFNENMNMQSSLMNRLTLSAGVSMSEVDPKVRGRTVVSVKGQDGGQGEFVCMCVCVWGGGGPKGHTIFNKQTF